MSKIRIYSSSVTFFHITLLIVFGLCVADEPDMAVLVTDLSEVILSTSYLGTDMRSIILCD